MDSSRYFLSLPPDKYRKYHTMIPDGMYCMAWKPKIVVNYICKNLMKDQLFTRFFKSTNLFQKSIVRGNGEVIERQEFRRS